MVFEIHAGTVRGMARHRKHWTCVAADCMLEHWRKQKRMFFSKGNREHERYYLLPGQGGPAARRKQKYFLKWAIVACLIFCALMALVMYLFNGLRPF
jgi:hypothetical protein